MDKDTLKALQEYHTKMVYNKTTKQDEPVLHINWEYYHALNGTTDTSKKTVKIVPEGDEMVLAFYKKERHGKKIRNVPYSCPKRLLDIVQKAGQDKYEKDFVFPPTLKKDKV